MQSKLFQFLLVLFFAGSVVLMGTKELHRRFVSKRAGKGDAKLLIQQLRGELDVMKATATRQDLETQREVNAIPVESESTVESMMRKLIP